MRERARGASAGAPPPALLRPPSSGPTAPYVLITTPRMDKVSVDPEARTVRVQAGVRWGQVVAAAEPYGLAPLNGSAPGVGAVSYTLSGGLGILAREFGYAADHVRSLDVVTA